MLEEQFSPDSISVKPSVRTYLEYNRRLQKWAWVSAALSIGIFVTIVIYGSIHLKRLQEKVDEKKVELVGTQVEITLRQDEITKLEDRRAAVLQQINDFGSLITKSAETGQQLARSVSGHPVLVSIDIDASRNPEEAAKVADVFRSHGYTVTGTEVSRGGGSPHETTVRFFQYDRSTVAIGKDLVALMKGIGFTVRTEFDDEFVGADSGPAPGTYEVWIGTNASYNPANRAP